jgi:hypothetical protein
MDPADEADCDARRQRSRRDFSVTIMSTQACLDVQSGGQRLMPMSWQTALTLFVPATVVAVSWFVAFQHNLRLAERRDQLDRVTSQLRDFYGPLFAMASAGASSWSVFRSIYRFEVDSYWNDPPPPTAEEAVAWRLWMTEVFMPLNRQMQQIVVARADLLEESEMPGCLLDLCAHVAAYEPILKRWERSDFSDHFPPLPFPPTLFPYLSTSFSRLKGKQRILLD